MMSDERWECCGHMLSGHTTWKHCPFCGKPRPSTVNALNAEVLRLRAENAKLAQERDELRELQQSAHVMALNQKIGNLTRELEEARKETAAIRDTLNHTKSEVVPSQPAPVTTELNAWILPRMIRSEDAKELIGAALRDQATAVDAVVETLRKQLADKLDHALRDNGGLNGVAAVRAIIDELK